MEVRMLVSISRSDGTGFRIGEVKDLPDDEAAEMLDDGRAELPLDDAPDQPAPESGKPVPIDASAESGEIDLADGVDAGEARLAGKALQQRRKRRAAVADRAAKAGE